MKTLNRVRATARSLSAKAWREVRRDPLRAAVVGGIFLIPVPGSMIASAALATVWKPRRGTRSNPALAQDGWILFASGKYYLATKDGSHVVPIDRALGKALVDATGARRSRRSGRSPYGASGRSKSRRGSGSGQRRGNPTVRWSREDGAAGVVPRQQEIDYTGFTVHMSPDEFLALNPHVYKPTAGTLAYLAKGGPVAPPWLGVTWEDGYWQVENHEGRHRAMHAKRLGVKRIPVDILLNRGLRARHLTPAMRRAPFHADRRADSPAVVLPEV